MRHQTAASFLRGLASLPVAADWTCRVTDKLVRWERIRGLRRIIVEWRRNSPQKHEWSARSEPLGKGQSKTLGGSTGPISRGQAVRDLEEFFGV